MTKKYTQSVPTTQTFLSSEPPAGVDLDEYQGILLNVRGVPTFLYAERNYLGKVYAKSKDKLPEDWIKQLVYDSIETQGDQLVYTLILSDQLEEFTPEEVNARIDVLTQISGPVTEEDI